MAAPTADAPKIRSHEVTDGYQNAPARAMLRAVGMTDADWSKAQVGVGDAALITDGRLSGGTHGFCIGHVAPEAVDGGPIAFVEEGDRIVIDVHGHAIDLMVDEAELARRKANWKLPEPRYTWRVLAKDARLAQGAEKGAITEA